VKREKGGKTSANLPAGTVTEQKRDLPSEWSKLKALLSAQGRLRTGRNHGKKKSRGNVIAKNTITTCSTHRKQREKKTFLNGTNGALDEFRK